MSLITKDILYQHTYLNYPITLVIKSTNPQNQDTKRRLELSDASEYAGSKSWLDYKCQAEKQSVPTRVSLRQRSESGKAMTGSESDHVVFGDSDLVSCVPHQKNQYKHDTDYLYTTSHIRRRHYIKQETEDSHFSLDGEQQRLINTDEDDHVQPRGTAAEVESNGRLETKTSSGKDKSKTSQRKMSVQSQTLSGPKNIAVVEPFGVEKASRDKRNIHDEDVDERNAAAVIIQAWYKLCRAKWRFHYDNVNLLESEHFATQSYSESDDLNEELSTYYKLPSNVDSNMGLIRTQPQISKKLWRSLRDNWLKSKRFQKREIKICTQLISNNTSTLILIGGINPLDPKDYEIGTQLLIYKSTSNEWNYLGLLPESRNYHAACYCNGHIYIVGGYSPFLCAQGEMIATATTFQIDVYTGKCQRLAYMNYPRACHSIVSFKNKLYAFGGRDNTGSIISTVEVYSMKKNVWRVKSISPIPEALMGMAVTSTGDSIFLIGGITQYNIEEDASLSTSVFSYNPERNSWQRRASLTVPQAYASAVSIGHQIWFLGGATTSESGQLISTGMVNIYDTLTDQWKEILYMIPEKHAVATCISEGQIFVAGGMRSDERRASNSFASYNILLGKFKKRASLFMPVTGTVLLEIPAERQQSKHPQEKEDALKCPGSCSFQENFSKSKDTVRSRIVSHKKRLIHKHIMAHVEYELELDNTGEDDSEGLANSDC